MKILFVASYNRGRFAPFVTEQAEALAAQGVEVNWFALTGKGIIGYMKQLPILRRIVKEKQIDLIHAHYGLCGLLCCLQRFVPVVVTYHGSDINNPRVRPLSRLAMTLSAWNIFVSRRTMDLVDPYRRYSLLPCGIVMPKEPSDCPDMSGAMEPNKRHILFAGAYNNGVKNATLAFQTMKLVGDEAQLIELKGYLRDEVSALMYCCDAMLMTSLTEGSPQVVKEALACGCPIVSVDVGDVKERLDGLNGCYVATTRQPAELAGLLRQAMDYGRTDGRNRILADGLTDSQVAEQILKIYTDILNRR